MPDDPRRFPPPWSAEETEACFPLVGHSCRSSYHHGLRCNFATEPAKSDRMTAKLKAMEPNVTRLSRVSFRRNCVGVVGG
jgi:hypothetical protein